MPLGGLEGGGGSTTLHHKPRHRCATDYATGVPWDAPHLVQHISLAIGHVMGCAIVYCDIWYMVVIENSSCLHVLGGVWVAKGLAKDFDERHVEFIKGWEHVVCRRAIAPLRHCDTKCSTTQLPAS